MVNHDSAWDPFIVGVAAVHRRQVRALAKSCASPALTECVIIVPSRTQATTNRRWPYFRHLFESNVVIIYLGANARKLVGIRTEKSDLGDRSTRLEERRPGK